MSEWEWGRKGVRELELENFNTQGHKDSSVKESRERET